MLCKAAKTDSSSVAEMLVESHREVGLGPGMAKMPYCRSAIVCSSVAQQMTLELASHFINPNGHCQRLQNLLAARLGFNSWSLMMAEPRLLVRLDDLQWVMPSVAEHCCFGPVVQAAYLAYCQPSIYAAPGTPLSCVLADKMDWRFDPSTGYPSSSGRGWAFALPGSACSASAWDRLELGLIEAMKLNQLTQYEQIQELIDEVAQEFIRFPVGASEYLRASVDLQAELLNCQTDNDIRRALANHYEPGRDEAVSLDELYQLALLMMAMCKST